MISFEDKLRTLREQGLLRQRRTVEGPQEAVLAVDGTPLLAFASNDYLGLAHHPDLTRAAHQALDHYGLGAGASALISGHSAPVAALESALAHWLALRDTVWAACGQRARSAGNTRWRR